MKVTKTALILILTVFLFSTCEKIERDIYSNEDGRFVRFNLMVDSDGRQVDDSKLYPGATVVSSFEHRKIQSLAIPVTLTSEPLDNEVTVSFSTTLNGTIDSVKIDPPDKVRFSGKQLTDTIFMEFVERWDPATNASIKLKLESASEADIKIGFPNNYDPYNELTILLKELSLRYSLLGSNMVEINGLTGEQVQIDFSFPDGLFPSEIENFEMFDVQNPDFLYSIEMLPLQEKDTKVSYIFTVLEDINIDYYSFTNILEINPLPTYTLTGNTKLTITKPKSYNRDNSVNTAANFYNLNDQYYRTYGESWLYDAPDSTCEWSTFNAFTYPVVVNADHPDAILYDDKGTEDPADDIYHHAFRIGFNSPNIGNTTNSFNLKRWFNNESINAEKSPGFNITQALEFFPEGGNSATQGMVMVIPQDLVIAGTNGNSYVISIEGEGEYHEVSNGIFELNFELRATNNELFGGTVAVKYYLYNTSDYEEPMDPGADCLEPMNL